MMRICLSPRCFLQGLARSRKSVSLQSQCFWSSNPPEGKCVGQYCKVITYGHHEWLNRGTRTPHSVTSLYFPHRSTCGRSHSETHDDIRHFIKCKLHALDICHRCTVYANSLTGEEALTLAFVDGSTVSYTPMKNSGSNMSWIKQRNFTRLLGFR